MAEISFYPLFGLVFGADYYNDEMDELQLSDEKVHTFTIYLLLVGLQFRWTTNRK
jgi:hypothetical protein